MSSKAPRNPNQSGGLAGWIPWVVAVVLVAGIAIVAVVSAKKDDTSGIKEWEENASVEVDGDNLPPLDDPANDPAAGQELPEIVGSDAQSGDPVTIGDNGKGKVIIVTAHWCPTCQNEVPKIVEHLKAAPAPDNVEVVGITTDLTSSRGNFPPSDWLDGVNWKIPTIVDDDANTGSAALGITAFPSFVVVDADNRVIARNSGAIDMAQLDLMLEAAAGGA